MNGGRGGRKDRQRRAGPPRLLLPPLSLALVAAAVLLIAAPSSASKPTELNVTVLMGDFWFSPTYITVDVNTTVNITVVNQAEQLHEFEVLGYEEQAVVGPHENATLSVLANRTGIFTIICGVTGHSTQGMIGRFVVVGPGFELNPLPQVASQIIGLVVAVEEEYEGANVSGGVAQNEGEYNEAKDFAQAAADLWRTIREEAVARDDSGAAKVDAAFAALQSKIGAHRDVAEVGAEVDVIKEELEEIAGAPPPGTGGTWKEHLDALRTGLDAVVEMYKAGNHAGADTMLGDLYLAHVEPLEDFLQPLDPVLKGRMESEIIVDLRGLLRSNASASAVDAKLAEVKATLVQVGSTLEAGDQPRTVTVVQKELDLALLGSLGIALAALAALVVLLGLRVSKLNRSAGQAGKGEGPDEGKRA